MSIGGTRWRWGALALTCAMAASGCADDESLDGDPDLSVRLDGGEDGARPDAVVDAHQPDASPPDAGLPAGACDEAGQGCLETERCVGGQCLRLADPRCDQRAEGDPCTDVDTTIYCGPQFFDTLPCQRLFWRSQPPANAVCTQGECRASGVGTGQLISGECPPDEVCVPSRLSGLQPCQARARVAACVED